MMRGMRDKTIAKLQQVREAGAVDNETHVVSLNIAEVADLLDEIGLRAAHIARAIRDEREACAKIVRIHGHGFPEAGVIETKIRERR